MRSAWPLVSLGEVLKKSEESTAIDPNVTYQEVTIKLWGKGVVQRREASGAEIAAQRRTVVRQGQFILSRIDARNGAFGLVPENLDGAVVSNDFPSFNLNQKRLEPKFLEWLSKTSAFVDLCKAASEGTTNRVRLKEEKFLAMALSLPSLVEQRLIVNKIHQISSRVGEVKSLRNSIITEQQQILTSSFSRLLQNSKYMKMRDIAPIVRRPVQIDFANGMYPELGIRSFGKGTFHKPAISGADVGTKKIYHILPGDLIFSNVFAWEGAIAIAKTEDKGRYGSHRFISCVAKEGVANASYLLFYFQTSEGFQKIKDASPGGAGRNRTLGLDALAKIEVPLPSFEKQLWFHGLCQQFDSLKRLQTETAAELDTMLPSILDKAFKGELIVNGSHE